MTFVRLGVVLCLIPIVYKAFAILVQRKLRAIFTAVDDLSTLAAPGINRRKIRGTAVICGGSIAGLLSARVCSDHFENVVIVDPEEWLATEEGLRDRHREPSPSGGPPSQKRNRIPHYTSLHSYHPFTLLALRRLFPQIVREIEFQGACLLPYDLKVHLSGVPLLAPYHQYPDGLLPQTMYLARPGFETLLRRMVLTTCLNVTCLTGRVIALVPGLLSSENVSAVLMRTSQGDEKTITAALVIDCTGQAQGGTRWIPISVPRIGPEIKRGIQDLKTSYDPKMSYTTCEFDVPTSTVNKIKALDLPCDYETSGNIYGFLPNPKKENKTLIITRREKKFLQIACGGWDVHERPRSITEIKNFVSLIISDRPIPGWIMTILEILEEDEVPATYAHVRVPPSMYVQYHRVAKLPSNFIAVGDSVLQLNPIRGQGCTKACVEAVTLNALLARRVPVSAVEGEGDLLPEDFSRRYFASQARRTGSLWAASKASDYGWKTTVPVPGDNPETFNAWNRAYHRQIVSLAMEDPEVAAVLWHVTCWLAPPTDLFSPQIVVKVVWKMLKAKFQ